MRATYKSLPGRREKVFRRIAEFPLCGLELLGPVYPALTR